MKIQALILAGGKGIRLRPLTLTTPKPIVPIGNQPFLLRQIEMLKTAGVTDIILSLNYQPSKIEQVLGDGSRYGVRIIYLIEPEPLGTAGAYKFAERFIKQSTIVLNGDILTDIDLRFVVERHFQRRALATIVLTKVDNPATYGLVQTSKDSEVIKFLEKPKPEEAKDLKTINAGIYVLDPKVLDFIPKGEKYSFEYQLFPDLLKRKSRFFAFLTHNSYWLDIGTLERYQQAHDDLLSGKIKNFLTAKNDRSYAANYEIDDRSIIGKGCVFKAGAKIVNSILGEEVVVKEGASVHNSVIWAGTNIGSDVSIVNSIIGYNCLIGKNVSISSGSVLECNSVLRDFSAI